MTVSLSENLNLNLNMRKSSDVNKSDHQIILNRILDLISYPSFRIGCSRVAYLYK